MTSTKKILVFVFITFALSSIFYYFIISSGSIQGYSTFLMWCPGVAALITQLIFQGNFRDLGWSIKSVKYMGVSYGLPVLYGLVVYGIVWLTGLGPFVPEDVAKQMETVLPTSIQSPYLSVAIYVLFSATVGVVISCGSALGEEIGWRGLLVPELTKRYSFTVTALVSGLIWAIWHYPLILFANYNNTSVSNGFCLVCFTVIVIGISFAFAWLRLKSGSLWTAVLLHGSHNLFIQTLYNPLTGNTSVTPYVIGEFGLGLAFVALLVAYLFWRKRGELPPISGVI